MKKIIYLLVAVLMLSSVLVGCGGGDTDQQDGQGNGNGGGEQTTIRLGVWASSPAETELLDSQIAALEEANPNIKIDKQVITGDYNQQMQTNIAANTEPDVYYLDVSLAPAYIDREVILPIDEYLDQEDVNDFEENLLAGFSKDDKIYGLPKDYNTLTLFYNKEMLESAGVEVPTTWAELETAAKNLTKDGVYGLSLSNDPARFIPFIYQAGGKVIEDDNIVFNSDEAAKGLDFYYSLINNSYAATPKDMGVDWNGSALAEKKAAMVIEGGWMIPFMKDAAPDVDYGIARLPKGDQEGDLAFTVAYVMSRNAKNKEAAADVIKFLTNKDTQKLTSDSGLAIPSRKSMSNDFTDKFPERSPLVEMVEFSQPYQFGVNGQQILDVLTKAGEKIQIGTVPDAKTALEEAESELQ